MDQVQYMKHLTIFEYLLEYQLTFTTIHLKENDIYFNDIEFKNIENTQQILFQIQLEG